MADLGQILDERQAVMEKAICERRFARVRVAPEMLLFMPRPGEMVSCIGIDIPEDAHVRHVWWDYDRASWNVSFAHESFAKVPKHELIPFVFGPGLLPEVTIAPAGSLPPSGISIPMPLVKPNAEPPPRFVCEQCGKDTRTVCHWSDSKDGGAGVGYDWQCGCKTTDDGRDGAGARVLDAEDAWAGRQRRLHEKYASRIAELMGRCPCYPCRREDDDDEDG